MLGSAEVLEVVETKAARAVKVAKEEKEEKAAAAAAAAAGLIPPPQADYLSPTLRGWTHGSPASRAPSCAATPAASTRARQGGLYTCESS